MSTPAKIPPNRSIITLTHYGRKTGKPYKVKIWYVVIDGKVWVGSLKRERNWVRNVRASGRAELDFGFGPQAAKLKWSGSGPELTRFARAVRKKYYILSPIIELFVRANPCAFETDLAAAAA